MPQVGLIEMEAGADWPAVIGAIHAAQPAEHERWSIRQKQTLRDAGVQDIYGTIRSIRRDQTTFLPWAKADYACVIFNLRTPHAARGIAHSRRVPRSTRQRCR